jgi:hypothetical protein
MIIRELPKMRDWALPVLMLLCAACDRRAEAGQKPGSFDPVTANFAAANLQPDLPTGSRALLFSQIDLYLAGGEAAPGSQLAQMLSSMGREDLISGVTSSARLPACGRQWVSPPRMIAEAARETSIVIISEAHDDPRHRAFIADTVRALHAVGYTVYAAEALGRVNTASLSDVPLESEGVLSREPIFGRLLRTVKALDMEIVDYEQSPAEALAALQLSTSDQTERRGAMRIDNLMSKIFSERPRWPGAAPVN